MTRRVHQSIAIAAIVTGLVVAVGGPIVVGRMGSAAEDSLVVTSNALVAVAETVEVAASSIGTVRTSLGSVAAASDELSVTVDASTEVLDEVAELTANEIPESLEAFQDSLPALISVGGAIDGTLRTLSFFGVEYDPERPFDEALAALGTALEGVPERLREQSVNLEEATTGIRGVVDNTRDIATSIAALDADIRVTEELLGEYRVTTGQAARLVSDARDEVRVAVVLTQVFLVLFGLVFAATQLPVLVGANRQQDGSDEADERSRTVEPGELAESQPQGLGQQSNSAGDPDSRQGGDPELRSN